MTLAETPYAPHYTPPPASKEQLDYADLAVIDLSKAASETGRIELAQQIRGALKTAGFFYVTRRIFDIADIPFSAVSEEEKRSYAANILATGSYQGYKLRQYWHVHNGVRDEIEHYNIHRDINQREHPISLRPYLPEIQAFTEHNHFNVLHPILRCLAMGLDLPEETFVEKHGFSSIGETWLRFLKYHPRSEEDEQKSEKVWLKGHTDFGSITLLYSQPVSALQIFTQSGEWKWIKHIENALIINIGDAIEWLTGGIYRATIHRVRQPPDDQHGYARLGVIYFAQTDDDVKLVPLPALRGIGPGNHFTDEEAPTMEMHRKGRAMAYGQTQTTKSEGNVEEEVINGIVVKHYN
ncbi:Clavaminate synthase-like protein [Mucidula mucida]|nr:Clavaminate synthase-like protein [Mucidula mucida]